MRPVFVHPVASVRQEFAQRANETDCSQRPTRALARRIGQWMGAGFFALLLSLGLTLSPASAQENIGGYYYHVEHGDSWTSVAHEVGLTPGQLQAVNPHHLHDSHWLIAGHTLFIPLNYQGLETDGTYEVEADDSWEEIADRYGVSVRLLWTANHKLIRPHLVLRPGDLIAIPTGAVAPEESSSEAPDGEAPDGEATGEEPTGEAQEGDESLALTPQGYLRELLMLEYGLDSESGPQIDVAAVSFGEGEESTNVNIAYTTGSIFGLPEESTFTNHFMAVYSDAESGFELIERFDLPEILPEVSSVTFAPDDPGMALITASYLPGGAFYIMDLRPDGVTQVYEGDGGRTINTRMVKVGPDRYGVLARYAFGGPIPPAFFTEAYLVAPVDGTYTEVYSETFADGALIAGIEPDPEVADAGYPTVDYRFLLNGADFYLMGVRIMDGDDDITTLYQFVDGDYTRIE